MINGRITAMHTNVFEYLEQTISRLPEEVAVRDSGRSLTFSDLHAAALSGATRILEKNPEKNQPIAIFLPKSSEALIAVCSILASGNCYVPLDIKSPESRLSAILDSLGNPLVVTKTEFQETLVRLGVPAPQIILIDSLPETTDPAALARHRSSVIDTDPAYIIFTSGSTGTPKGVVISHRSIIDYIEWARSVYPVKNSDRIASQAPLHFDNSTLDIYLCLSCGAAFVIVPDQLFSFPARLVQFLRDESISMIFWVPSILVNAANLKALDGVSLPALDKVLFAGEVMPNKHLNYWRKQLPHALFSNLYGPTEITVDCTYLLVDRDYSDDEPLPIGIPCRNSDIIILNEQNQRVTTSGQIGELCVRGSSLALGYWNDPEKTAQAFVQNPLQTHYPERIYRTGDLVSLNNQGEIMFIGRKDSQIKHMGYRIELGEIETALLGYPGIENGCILYHAIKKEITAFYTSAMEIPAATLRSELGKSLPQYMLPRTAIRLDIMPLSANGKIDRLALTKAYLT